MTDQDKDRLAKIMAYGKDCDKWPTKKIDLDYEPEEQEEPDRFDERMLNIKITNNTLFHILIIVFNNLNSKR